MNGNDLPGQPKSDLTGKIVLLVNTNSANDALHSKKFFIKKVKNLGVKIILLGKEAASFQPLVDYVIVADTTNFVESLSALESFLQVNSEIKLDGVGTFLEDDVLLTAKIADKYHLIGPSFKVANRARNKYLFREFCQKNNLPIIKHKELKNNRDLEDIIKNFTFPLVVKPAYGAGSAFVVRVNNEEELRESYDYIKKQLSPQVESALNDGLGVFVEEYIDGDEVDMDILVQNGKLKFCAISDNAQTKEPFFIETTRMTPSNLPAKNQAQLVALADETLEKLGILNGCLHFEAKSTHKGPVPLEINLRMGGGEIYYSLKVAWRIDLVENYIKIICGIYIPKFEFTSGPYS